jgi:hypothetical protein
MPSAWQGAWLGIWPGDWFGESEGGTGPAYLDAELNVLAAASAVLAARLRIVAALDASGAGSAQLGAVVEGGTVQPLPALGGGVFRRRRDRRRLYTLLRATGQGSAQFGAIVIPPALGRTARRRKSEHDLLLLAA